MGQKGESLSARAAAAWRSIKRLISGGTLYEKLRGRMLEISVARTRRACAATSRVLRREIAKALELAKHIAKTFGDHRSVFECLRWAYGNLGGALLRARQSRRAHDALVQGVHLARRILALDENNASVSPTSDTR